jgi:hypothetical protein
LLKKSTFGNTLKLLTDPGVSLQGPHLIKSRRWHFPSANPPGRIQLLDEHIIAKT